MISIGLMSKCREEFTEWARLHFPAYSNIDRYWAHGRYTQPQLNDAWLAWKESREMHKVCLPSIPVWYANLYHTETHLLQTALEEISYNLASKGFEVVWQQPA